ncbi:MAG: glycosyltransferase family 4 protein [Elusimicrobia bacterium]|nr:glycosyltransferase family 4 protein [Elusimicrobiota bacterium]
MRFKVVHVITRLDLGGAQGNTLYTARHLDAGKFDCLLVAGAGGTLDEDAASAVPPRVAFLPDLVREVNPWRDLLALARLTRLFRAERPDVVHTHSSKAGVLGRLAARLAGVPAIVHTYHGFGFHDRMPRLLKWFYVSIERACCRLTHRVIFVSRANRDEALALGLVGPGRGPRGLGPGGRHVVIRSGIKLSAFPAPLADRRSALAAVGLGGSGLLVTSVGNLKPQKNPADFLSLAKSLAGRAPEAGFLFVGDGPLRGALQRDIDAQGLGGRLVLAGWRRDVGELLAATDVFVLTSLWEGLPRALLEAMASGKACACYATDGVKDILRDGENGFLVPAGDLALLGRRVGELLADPALRARLGGNARRSVTAEFDIDGMVRSQEELYLSLLEPQPPHPAVRGWGFAPL